MKGKNEIIAESDAVFQAIAQIDAFPHLAAKSNRKISERKNRIMSKNHLQYKETGGNDI